MRITEIRTWLVQIPLSEPYVISRGTLDRFSNVVVEIATDTGLAGYGEAVPVSLLGDPHAYLRVIKTVFTPHLLGRDPREIEALIDLLLALPGSVTAAVAGIDLALWDIAGKALNAPVHALLGGLCAALVQVDYTLSVASPAAMAANAAEMVAAGFGGVVVKLACQNPDEDLARLRTVRSALPPGASLRADCNGGLSRDAAFAFLPRIAGLGLEFIEQPVAAADLEGMSMCRGMGVAIAADESLSTPADALALVRAGACDVMNVKVPKAGGLLQAKRIAGIAAAAGLPLVVGGGLTYGPSRCASQHLAASSSAAQGRCHQGPGPASQALIDDITEPRLTRAIVTAGHVPVPQAPGLGFSMMAEKLAQYSV